MPRVRDRPITRTKEAARQDGTQRQQPPGREIASPISVPFKLTTRPAYSLHDALLTLFDGAIGTLRSSEGDEAVHAARKACKRIRAALRLLRRCVGSRVYRRENRRVRDAAKPLTAIRDAFMLRRTLRTLPERPIPLRSGLDSEYRRGRQTLKRRGARIALEQLTATREKLVELPAADAEAASAIAGIGKVYRSGRKALWKARHTDDQALHAWRKQSKYLLNQLELLKSVFNVRFKKLRRRADQLAEALGDDHDLAVFISKLRLYEPQARPLGKYIKKRRRKLQARALRLGKQLYRHLAKHIEAASRRSCREPTKARLGGGDRADFR